MKPTTPEPQHEINPSLKEFGATLVLKFDNQPTAEDICTGLVSAFQKACLSILNKEEIGNAVVDAEKVKSREFAVRLSLDKEGVFNGMISVMKAKSAVQKLTPQKLILIDRLGSKGF